MIRPITVICWILALSAGLYLYRAKHEVELMDKHIDQIARETTDIRAESRRLLDDWIRLGEPEQLHKYSDEYLGLKSVSPTQFVRLSDLPSRLPAPRADAPEEPVVATAAPQPPAVDAPPVQQAAAVATDDVDEADAGDLPVPPIPPPAAVLTSVSLPAVGAVPLQAKPITPRPTAASPDQGTPRPHTDEPRVVVAKPLPATPNDPRPVAPVQAAAQTPGPSASPVRGLPPLQAQAEPPRGEVPRVNPRGEGLPPLQAQIAEPLPRGTPITRQAAAPSPAQAPIAEPRPPITRQAAVPPPAQAAVAPGTSLLGMSRGVVPLPLPAPMPVSATWPGPAAAGPVGQGR